MLPGTGIVLNNMLGEADLNPGGLHGWPTDKRMASMMTPAIVLDAAGGVTALGSGGSKRIRTAMLQALLNLLAFDMRLEEAIAAPRLHVEDEKLSLEPGLPGTNVYPSRASSPASSAGPARTCSSAACTRFGGPVRVRLDGAGDERRGGVVGVA